MDIQKKELQMWEAARSRNSEKFLEFVSAEAVMVCGGIRCSGLDYSYIIKEFDIDRYTISDFEVICETEEMCQVHYWIETFVADPRNMDLQGRFYITSTWKKMGDDWKLIFNMDARKAIYS